jgi:hypothetical protein
MAAISICALLVDASASDKPLKLGFAGDPASWGISSLELDFASLILLHFLELQDCPYRGMIADLGIVPDSGFGCKKITPKNMIHRQLKTAVGF